MHVTWSTQAAGYVIRRVVDLRLRHALEAYYFTRKGYDL